MTTGCPKCGSEAELVDAERDGDKKCPKCGMLWTNLENVEHGDENDPQNGDNGK